MFTSESATTTAGGPAATIDPASDELLNRLRGIVQEHQVCYEVWPEWYMKDGVKIKIGFELQLCGINAHLASDGSGHHPVPGCPICFRTYNELREIAEWALPIDERPSRYEIQAFDHALHLASAKRFRRREVVVTIVIMHRNDFNRPVDDCENRCLREMKERLNQLGIHEDVWRQERGKQ